MVSLLREVSGSSTSQLLAENDHSGSTHPNLGERLTILWRTADDHDLQALPAPLILPRREATSGVWLEHSRPQVIVGVQRMDGVHIDVDASHGDRDRTSDPPLSTRQPGRGIGACSRLHRLVGRPSLSDHLAVRRFPQVNRTCIPLGEDDGVVPPPHHDLAARRRRGDRYEMTSRHPLDSRRREQRSESNGGGCASSPDLTRLLCDPQNTGTSKARGNSGGGRRGGHAPSVARTWPTKFITSPAWIT